MLNVGGTERVVDFAVVLGTAEGRVADPRAEAGRRQAGAEEATGENATTGTNRLIGA